ncbi:HupE/UreJ family protein [Flavobacteriaceae bacterium]|nr:HupE/UreJ family protein [Flavobacteriaceae bacterium]
MLDSFLKFLELGLYHIVNFKSYDHILFLVVLTIPYLFKDWKRLLLLVSSFTLGHTLSLLLGVYDIVNLNVNVTEWLIPFTIIVMALYNIFTSGKSSKYSNPIVLFSVVLFFGFIHGLGFANAFETLVRPNESTLLSVLEFALGIELGQFIIVFCVLFFGFVGQTIFRFSVRDWVMVLSAVVIGLMLPLIVNSPLFS